MPIESISCLQVQDFADESVGIEDAPRDQPINKTPPSTVQDNTVEQDEQGDQRNLTRFHLEQQGNQFLPSLPLFLPEDLYSSMEFEEGVLETQPGISTETITQNGTLFDH